MKVKSSCAAGRPCHSLTLRANTESADEPRPADSPLCSAMRSADCNDKSDPKSTDHIAASYRAWRCGALRQGAWHLVHCGRRALPHFPCYSIVRTEIGRAHV